MPSLRLPKPRARAARLSWRAFVLAGALSLFAGPSAGAELSPLEFELAAKGKAGATKAVEITFSGFVTHDDGRATVFVELSAPVAVEMAQAKRTVTYTLNGAKIAIRNNRNPLLTQHFASIVLSARLVPDKKATRLVVELKEDAAPSHRMVSRDGGAALEVDFPAPKAKSTN